MLASFDDGSARITLGGSSAYDYRNAPETLFELVAPGRGGVGFEARIAGRNNEELPASSFRADAWPTSSGDDASFNRGCHCFRRSCPFALW
jgi:hypothetical protein